jgi:hypothetical protein
MYILNLDFLTLIENATVRLWDVLRMHHTTGAAWSTKHFPSSTPSSQHSTCPESDVEAVTKARDGAGSVRQ